MQVSLAVAALYLAKILVATMMCAAPFGVAGATADGASPNLPRLLVLCTPAGLRTIALDGDGADGGGPDGGSTKDRKAPGTHGGDCPICAAHCKLPLVPVATMVVGEHRIVARRAPWTAPGRPLPRSRWHAYFQSRAPPERRS